MKIRELPARVLYKIGNKLVKISNRQPRPSRFVTCFPPGHYYNALPDEAFVDGNAATLFKNPVSVPGIDLNLSGQRQLVAELLEYAGDYTPALTAETGDGRRRFYSSNPLYKEKDAYFYYAMLRRFQPKRVVEVGSGFTSALAVEVCERFVNPQPQFVFVDPDPERLHALFPKNTRANVSILEMPVQQADKGLFLQLEAKDFLFIDSSHVSKIGSDVNYLYFEVLPLLKKGVIIHVHDILWPFEYPKHWLDEGRSWNEAYLLRGLLSDSSRYRILCSVSYLARQQVDLLKKLPSWAAQDQLSSSIWLEVVA